MGNSDWLAIQAEHEKNRRLYGGKPPRDSVWRALLAALAWSVGTVVALSAAFGLALFLLARYGSDEYVLVCEGTVSAEGTGAVPATMYAEMREFGQIIRLWSKDAGTVRMEIPNDFYDAGQLRSAGSLTFISTYTGLSGHFSGLSGALAMRMGKGRDFQGQCVRRGQPTS
ncbi:hypothetical protein EKT70_06020 [Stenotrophomonas geniculata]|jgi:hypothetical protein|uniref:hypothetical protein n=1 Tax=Stenotrophomonas geniculata TaxID=86188 RepID=UPI000F81DFA7|nr:hypothetical protein [Stenotrophomonas geniculata]RTY14792.1 hypothetical protein EKT70_06020 [Stenotrophomonas geniculata]